MTAFADRVMPDAQALEQVGGHGLAAEDADRPGQRSRLGDNRVGAHGDVVPAGCSNVAHRGDQRHSGGARTRDLTPDDVGGDVGATG